MSTGDGHPAPLDENPSQMRILTLDHTFVSLWADQKGVNTGYCGQVEEPLLSRRQHLEEFVLDVG